MKIKGKSYKPIGNELGYCLGGSLFRRKVFYFKGYPNLPYEECEIIQLEKADPSSFTSDTVMGEGRDKKNKYFQGKTVNKGKGQNLNQDWEFIPLKGIKCQTVELFFGSNRKSNRELLGNEEEFNYSRTTSEDSYEEFQNTDTWIRLSYDEYDELNEIEFLQGSLRIGELKLIGTKEDVKRILQNLNKINFKLVRKEEYWINTENKFTISSSKDMGGDSNEIVYFYTTKEIDHLLDE